MILKFSAFQFEGFVEALEKNSYPSCWESEMFVRLAKLFLKCWLYTSLKLLKLKLKLS